MSTHFSTLGLVPAANKTRSRAPHLPLQERRAALIAATRDALLTHAAIPTTKQIAAAAGVAEGTIFRVFDSKEALLDAVMLDCFAQDDLLVAIDAIEPHLPLRQRLYRVAEILQARLHRIFDLMAALGLVAPPNDPDARRRAEDADPVLVAHLQAVIGDDADQLSVPPAEAIHLLRLLTFSGSHPRISHGHVLPPHRIVDVLLDGISAQPDPPVRRKAPAP